MKEWTVTLDGYEPVIVKAATRSAARYVGFKLLRDSALDHPSYSDAATWRANMSFKDFCQRTVVS